MNNQPETTAPAAPANTAATVTLECPITRGATTITQLHLRKPKAGALRGINLAELLQQAARVQAALDAPIAGSRCLPPGLEKHELRALVRELRQHSHVRAGLWCADAAMKLRAGGPIWC